MSRGPACLGLAELARYFAGALGEDESFTVEAHLVSCPHCLALSERAALHARDALEAKVETLRELDFLFDADLPLESPDLRERLRRWADIGADLAVGVKVAAFDLVSFASMVAPASPFDMVRAAISGQSRAIDGAPTGARILQVEGGELAARVFVDPARRVVSVQVDNFPAAARTPLAAIRLLPGSETTVREMTRHESLSGDASQVDLVADFELPPAAVEYLVLLEPTGR